MLKIREVVESDLEDLLALYDHFHRADDSAPEGIARAWQQVLAQPGLFVYVGEVGNQFVASCTLVPTLATRMTAEHVSTPVVRSFGTILVEPKRTR